MRELPTGTVTFFFSDIEGSTRLLEALGSEYPALLERHRAIVRDAFQRFRGTEVGTQGDSFFAVFATAGDAARAAVEIQRMLAAERWPEGGELRVRIGLHTGEAAIAGGDYVGLDVHRAARIMTTGHGGQILMSAATRALLDTGRDAIGLRDLGEHRLRDLSAPERLFQATAPGLRDDFPALRSLDAVPNNLPAHVARLIGREAELASIGALLETARLVTLTGPGGIGKTTLALHVAAGRIERYRDGVWFVDLSDATDAHGALQAIVRSLGLSTAGSADLRDVIVAALDGRATLVILDNFEQVVAAAPTVAGLLSSCSEAAFLVTSREALRVRGEHVVPIEPLALPSTDERPTARPGLDALVLFTERAREVRPDFALTDENAPLVTEICARLDGVPLAIELAAARLRLFSLEELRDRLRLELLRGGARDLPARQQTLRGTIGWSYDLLDENERALFAVFSVFSTARIEAVEAVAGAIDALADADAIDGLASLVEKSLIRSTDEAGRQRLSMLETIREYAAERLAESPELERSARLAHAAYFADYASSRRRTLRGPGRDAVQAELVRELPNLMIAWRTLVDSRDLVRLNEMLEPLWIVHEARGWYHAAVDLTNDLLGVVPTTTDDGEGGADEAIALRLGLARGILAIRGYRPEVEALYRDALELTERTGTIPRQFAVLRSLASFHLARGEMDRTAAIGRQILELGERESDVGLQVEAHVILGPVLAIMGDPAGLEHLDRAIALFDPDVHGRTALRLGPNPGVTSLAVGALLRWMHGFPDTADRYAARALELAARLGHPYSAAYAGFHVGLLDLWNRRLESANARARGVMAVAEERDYPIWRAISLIMQGATTALLGRPDEGLATLERGIELYENLVAPPIFWPQVLGLKAVATAAAGRPAEALPLVDQALELAGPQDPMDRAPLSIIAADLLLALGERDAAESRLREAIDEARLIDVRMVELQALTRLVRLVRARDAGAAGGRLADLLSSLTEGMTSPDVVDARKALDDLVGARP